MKKDGDLYSTCMKCRLQNNKQSRESYQRREKPVCSECGKEYATEGTLKTHLWQVHDIGDGKWYECTECGKKFKTNSDLTKHLWGVHTIGNGRWHECTECGRKFKTNGELKTHLWGVHTIGDGKWHECMECGSKFKTNGELTRHLWGVHDIGDGRWHECTECGSKFKTNSGLTKHLWVVHNIGNRKWYECTECGKKFKTNGYLTSHLWHVHTIGDRKWHECTECGKKFKTNGKLTRHLWGVHDIGDGKWYECTECGSKFKTNGNLTEHLWQVHTIGDGKWHECTECGKKFKTNSILKKHLSNVHDVGDLQCGLCAKNVFKLNDYKDPNVGKVKVCRVCYKKAVGHSTSKEKQMVDYIKKTELKDYIVLTNEIIRGDSCDTKRRPDLLISSSPELLIFLECDESQHRGYVPDCEAGRMDEILDEVKDSRAVFVRWNPDPYMIDKDRGKVNREMRLKLLVKVLRQLCNKRWTEKDKTMVYYMFYSSNNPVIADRFPKRMIYNEKDCEGI